MRLLSYPNFPYTTYLYLYTPSYISISLYVYISILVYTYILLDTLHSPLGLYSFVCLCLSISPIGIHVFLYQGITKVIYSSDTI